MNLYLFDEEEIITFELPAKKIGNFWMTDCNNKNIVNINGENDKWILSGSENTKIITSNQDKKIELLPKKYYVVEKNEKRYALFCDYFNDDSFECYQIQQNSTIRIGKDPSNEVSINIPYLLDMHYSITLEGEKWKIQRNPNAQLYLNDEIIKDECVYANNGDIINSFGLKIALLKNIVFINNPFGLLIVSSSLTKKDLIVDDEITNEEITNEDLYKDADYFLKSPRMKKQIETLEMRVDSPPAKEIIQETPLIMTLAPMLTMGASSMITLSNTIQSITSGEKTWKQSLPSLVITISMLFSMLIWPFITRAYEKSRKIKKEKERQEKYKAYLDTKKEEIATEWENQKKILDESLLATNVCYDAIINKRRTLWGRRIDQNDFLTVRIGKGQIPFDANIQYHTEDFTMDDDNLKKMLDNLIKGYKILDNVPIGYSFTQNYLTTINGIYPKYEDFANNLLLQMMSYHSYDNLKFVVFTNKKNEKKWEYLKDSPYCFSNDKSIRFFATNTEEMQYISEYLSPIFENRSSFVSNIGGEIDFSNFSSYYLFIIDNIGVARKIGIIEKILDEKRNIGFSIMILEEKLSKVPSEFTKFITIGESASIILNSDNNNQIRFNDEISKDYDMNLVVKTLSNLPIYMDTTVKQLPNTITFLELFSVGQIEQLNVINRWKNNNPVKSLKTEIGVNENNDPFILDLHEKQHGPHGLVAGMTGSGKSEFIITYVLSMAVNYSPEEVAFVLIDYKGGGLAGAFVNSETGERLPHVVGTITNLDKTEINRALSSIQSELRRRQEKFNEVRDKMGESTIDIYKYQKLYREGVIDEPIPHLIIVCDEFAELKDQQPDFMEDLISTARIGRSLGVHLILATQKPSGVVDGQIWSNSKFKICLKVQDKSDSMEMIKNDLAAELKNVGRFYLQVGYNEYFAMGQSAWAGAQYYPNKEYKKTVDKNIYFINNTAEVERTINNSIARSQQNSQGEELTNIVKYLINIGKELPLKIKQLWLDKIPNSILVDDLYKKYNYTEEKFNLNPAIGEYDDPYNQKQGLLTLPISKDGNSVIYGISDSGKDELLQTITYSIITHHTSEEVNLYLVDFGAETLINFINAPQVGDVILSSEEDKLNNLVKLLYTELGRRKKLFIKYNGSYNIYIKQSGQTLPNIVVIINSIEVMNELYLELIDKFIPIIREGDKYGIHFIFTTENQNSIKLKISQTCKHTLCLQQNNESAYKDILGKTNGLVPTNALGRGLVKLERVCEFQTGFVTLNESPNIIINKVIETLNQNNMEKAVKVPIMPDTITINALRTKFNGINSIPIGIAKESLNISTYNFSKNVATVISTNELENVRGFISNFLKLLEIDNTFSKIIVDSNNFFETFNYKLGFLNNNFENSIDILQKESDKIKAVLEKNNMNIRSLKEIPNIMYLVIGFDKFYQKLSSEYKEKFIKLLDNCREHLKINFVFIDIPSAFKKYEYDMWYKDNLDTNYGIWIGQGLTQQFLIKTSVQLSSYSNISNEYCAVVTNSNPVIVKMINEIKNQIDK